MEAQKKPDRLFLKLAQGKLVQYKTNSIAYIKADGNYSIVHFLSGEKKCVTHSLLDLSQMLTHFIRIGRFHLLNVDEIEIVDFRSRTCQFSDDISVAFNKTSFSSLREYIESKGLIYD